MACECQQSQDLSSDEIKLFFFFLFFFAFFFSSFLLLLVGKVQILKYLIYVSCSLDVSLRHKFLNFDEIQFISFLWFVSAMCS